MTYTTLRFVPSNPMLTLPVTCVVPGATVEPLAGELMTTSMVWPVVVVPVPGFEAAFTVPLFDEPAEDFFGALDFVESLPALGLAVSAEVVGVDEDASPPDSPAGE